MPTAKELREKRAPLAKEIRRQADAVNDAGRDFNAEEKTAWEKVNADYNALTAQIERAETADKVEAEQTARVGDPRVGRDAIRLPEVENGDGAVSAITDTHRALAVASWFRSGRVNLSKPEAEACRLLGFNPRAEEMVLPLWPSATTQAFQERCQTVHPSRVRDALRSYEVQPQIGAALSIGSGPSGGYITPPTSMIRQLEVNMLYFGGMRQVSETITTSSGEPLAWPTADDTTNTGAQLGENTSIGSSVEPTFAQVLWSAYVFSSKPILVPYVLLQDSIVDLPSIIGQMFGERLGRITNTKYTTGTGAATAKGIITAASSGVTSASSSAIAADELFGLVHSIDPAYRTSGCGWMMHDSILLALRKLKDGIGRYLWQDGLESNTPDRLLGYPITINQDMASSLATTNKTLLFGQLFKYKIRRVGEMRMYRLQERYRDTDQDGFIAFIREDGNLLTAGTAPVKYLVQV